MERFKKFIFNHFQMVTTVMGASIFSLILLMLRLKITHSFFLLFLVWNLFLGAIPFGITLYLVNKPKIKKYALCVWVGIWLLFLPNAPYIITDFIHLTHMEASLIWLDTVLISSFALSGLIFYFLSFRDMGLLLHAHFTTKWTKYFLWLVPYLTGFGIYLGRFLRWNSWDLLQRPHILLADIWAIVTIPSEHVGAWLVTSSFGIGLTLGYKAFNRISFFKLKTS